MGLVRSKDQLLKRKTDGGSHRPTKTGRKQTNSTRKTLSWLFSQASGAPPSPRHHADSISQILEVSDNSESENQLEAEPGELRNDLPLSDPISAFPSSRETTGLGDGRAANVSPAEDKRVPTVPGKRSRSPLSSRDKPQKQASSSQCADDDKKGSTLAVQEVGPAANTEMQLPLLNGKLVPPVITRVLVLLHGKLVSLLMLVRLLVLPNRSLVP